jgi:hypothetical protein
MANTILTIAVGDVRKCSSKGLTQVERDDFVITLANCKYGETPLAKYEYDDEDFIVGEKTGKRYAYARPCESKVTKIYAL